MRRGIGRWRVLANLGFALAVLALGGFGLHQVAGRHWKVQPTFRVRAQFETICGLEAGHRVRLQGIDAGVVERVVPPGEPGRPVELVLRIDERLRPLVRADAVARIVSEGLVGAKVVELAPGRPEAPPVAELGPIASERPIEVSDLLKKAEGSLARLESLARSAENGLEEVNAITGSIRRGQGSLGKLVRDETIYQDLVTVARRGQRTLTALEENLEALKQTWPLSRYFDRRAYLDRERVLFQPGARRNSRALRAEDLFEPGRSVLTPLGRSRLDEVARWFKQASRPRSELVIAAFTDDDRDQDLAEVLTQEQADAVRKYLVEKHSVQSAGWFKHRKVAAVGFGTHVPRTLEPATPGQPARRVEIIVFTPQT
ncbi:MAG TPA: OmpA family protein [Isosphaeraceae bacterium]|nr:OmpA family protein [Isosphaeraceae bacterium]